MWRDFSLSRRNGNSGGGGGGETHSQSPSSTTSSFGSYQTKSTSEFHKNNVPQFINGQHQQQQQQLPQAPPQTRSAYSLPHPAHLQSNARWQNLHAHDQNAAAMMMMHQQQQRSTLMHSPSYPHIPSANGDHHLLRGDGERGGGGKPRPVSMYDMPPSSNGGGGGGGGFSFIPSILLPNRSKGQAPMPPGYNGSAPASLQHPSYYGKQQQQQQQQQAPKKGQIMRQGPGELVRGGIRIKKKGIPEESL